MARRKVSKGAAHFDMRLCFYISDKVCEFFPWLNADTIQSRIDFYLDLGDFSLFLRFTVQQVDVFALKGGGLY